MEAYKTNMLMWGLFMASSMKAAIHLGPRHTDNFEVYKNSEFEDIESLFNITKKLLSENSEIRNVNSIDSTSLFMDKWQL